MSGYYSHLLPKQHGGTFLILVNPTKVHDHHTQCFMWSLVGSNQYKQPHFAGNYDEEERDDGQVEDPYGSGGDVDYSGGRGGGDGYEEDGYTYGRTRDPCEGVDCPPVYWDGTPHL